MSGNIFFSVKIIPKLFFGEYNLRQCHEDYLFVQRMAIPTKNGIYDTFIYACMYNPFLLVLPACICPLGFTGPYCDKECPYPGYGGHCQMTCNCEEQYCNHTTGCQGIVLL